MCEGGKNEKVLQSCYSLLFYSDIGNLKLSKGTLKIVPLHHKQIFNE